MEQWDNGTMRDTHISFFALITTSVILSSCFGSDSCSSDVQAGPISLCINSEWEQVPDDALRREGVPEETLAAFQLTEQRAGQRDNIVVTQEKLPSKVKSKTYALTNVVTVEATTEYSLIEKREVKVGGDETVLHIFTARPVPDLPARRFYQLSFTKGLKGYVITGTLPYAVDDEIESGLVEMIMSSELK